MRVGHAVEPSLPLFVRMAHATQGWTVAHGAEKLPLRATVVLPEALDTITVGTAHNRLLQLWGSPSGLPLGA